jgi:glutaredoxin-related protein
MQRPLLPEDRVDPAIREVIASNHRDIIDEVEAAIAKNAVVVVGMKQNPFPRRARKALTEAGIAFAYLEYGSYFNTWRRRTALKIWSGWPTFPMVFVKGVLVGGATDVKKLLESGDLARRLAAGAHGSNGDARPGAATPAR